MKPTPSNSPLTWGEQRSSLPDKGGMRRVASHLSIIVAMAKNRVIGINNTLPWHLPADLKHFKSLTMGHHILMGRKTYESIGKPLPGRTSVVITRNAGYTAEGVTIAHTLEAAIAKCGDDPEIFIIGGAELYHQAIHLADRIYLTEIALDVKGDAHFTELDENVWQETERTSHTPDEKNPHAYHFVTYDKKVAHQ